jgi:hypothetical protein
MRNTSGIREKVNDSCILFWTDFGCADIAPAGLGGWGRRVKGLGLRPRVG